MSKSVAVCLIVCSLCISLALAIPTVYYGFSEEDATCQQGTRAGLTLSDWVKVQGLKTICVTFVTVVSFAMTALCDSDAAGVCAVVFISSQNYNSNYPPNNCKQ